MDVVKRFDKQNLTILKTVGKGTYGNVYLCENKSNAVLTIVKDIEMNIKLHAHKKDIANEVDILSTMDHPNIIKFYDCYYIENNVMICMEYASSGNLAEYMYRQYPNLIKQQLIPASYLARHEAPKGNERKTMAFFKRIFSNDDFQEILFYFCQILLGVNYIHSLNIVHRDLKAENILLTGKHGVIVKIGDFGISKMLASAKKTSTVIGTPYYLAPELCEGKPYDTKSDVWALGCLLYEMCTHKRAFEAETLVGLVKAITSASVHPVDLSVYARGVQDLIDSMLSILPDKRPTIKDLMGRMIVLPIVYTVFLDAGNDELLYENLKDTEL